MEKWGVLVMLIVFLLISFNKAEDEGLEQSSEDNEPFARKFWMQADKDLKNTVGKIIRKAMPVVMKEVYRREVSSTCMSALMSFANAMKNNKAWPYQLLDSSARIPEGMMTGTTTDLGNYDECIRITVNETKLKLKGQYCVLEVHPPIPTWKPYSPMGGPDPEFINISAADSVITHVTKKLHNLHVVTLKLGLCVPSLCTTKDMNELVQIIPHKMNVNIGFQVKRCETRESVKLSEPQVIVLYVIGIMVFLLLTGCIVDLFFSSKENEMKGYKLTMFLIAKSFSPISNAKKLSDWTCPQEKLSFVYGMTFFVYYWVVISDTFMYVNYDTTANFDEAIKILKELFYEIILNRVIPLQILFFISGLITAYRWLKCPDPGYSIWKFYLKRYIRYTPTYGLVLALILLTPTWGSGPSWYTHMNPMYQNCKSNWWYNLLYINNFVDSTEVCLDHTWIFAVLAQLHVLSIVILIPLKMRPKIGLMVNFVIIVASLVTVALTNVYYDLPPHEMLAFLSPKDRMFVAEHSYFRVYTHLSLFCCGIFVAYLVHEYPNIRISKKTCAFLWITTAIGIAAAFCVVHEWRTGFIPSPLISATYATISKVAEIAFLAWLSIACMTGYGGLINSFLSWRPFAFLARITFIAFLMHVPVINMVSAYKKTHFFINEFEVWYVALNYMVSTLVISYILHISFEAPFLSLKQVIKERLQNLIKNGEMEPPITEKTIKFSDKHVNIASTSPQLKVWMNICEKSNC